MARHYGPYGGAFVPETLVPALTELDRTWRSARKDPAFQREFRRLATTLGGRPTPLYFARNLTHRARGAQIWLKREDLLHTGAHKFNNALGQGLLARRMGKPRLIAETGAGQHGVATAMIGAALGLETEIYMGSVDMERQRPNVERMRLLGARVLPVRTGSRTLKDAINAALRDWITNVRTTHYLLGSAVGPYPFPAIVADFQSVIGREIRRQSVRAFGRLPDLAVACVGGGSNAIGTFRPLLSTSVELLGVEAGGRARSHGAASLTRG